MKTSNHRSLAVSLAAALLLAYGPHQAISATTTYSFDPAAANNTAWSTVNWSTTGSSPFNTSWVNGTDLAPSTAAFTFTTNRTVVLNNQTITFGAGGGINATVSQLTQISGGTNNPLSTINLNGATVNVSAGTLQFSGNAKPIGNFTLTNTATGTRPLQFGTINSAAAFEGTVTVKAGAAVNSLNSTATSTLSHVVIDGGEMWSTHASGNVTYGSVELKSGSILFGPSSDFTNSSVTFSELSATGGTIGVRGANLASNGSITNLIVNQATNTTFAGTFTGLSTTGGNSRNTALTKQGTGNLTFTEAMTNVQNVRVEGGGLWVSATSGANRSFGNHLGAAGSAALTIADGGTFGGHFTAALALSITGNRNIEVESGGRLSPGLVDGSGNPTIGLLRISFPDGGAIDLTDAVGNTGWLRFDLGSDATAGTTYDQINLTSGTLLIGNSLQFSDFQFTPTSGFDVGTYTLFSLTGTSALSGTLAGSGLTGNITGLYAGTLSLSGNNILLTVTVIPEPKVSMLLLGVGLFFLLATRRRRAA
jgi:hypothetical protein